MDVCDQINEILFELQMETIIILMLIMYHNLCVYILSSFISKGVALVVVMLSLNQMFFLLNVLFDMPVPYCIWFSWNRDT